jgi:hypothetical protein
MKYHGAFEFDGLFMFSRRMNFNFCPGMDLHIEENALSAIARQSLRYGMIRLHVLNFNND